MIKKSILFLVMYLSLSVLVFSNQACFSKSGKKLFFVKDEFKILDFETSTTIVVENSLGLNTICDITQTSQGLALVLSNNKIYSYDIEKNAWELYFFNLPADKKFSFIAYNPEDSTVLISGEEEYNQWILRCSDKKLLHLFNRLAKNVSFPVYDNSGNLFFECVGELWTGSTYFDSDDEMSEEQRFILEAFRTVPLFTPQTHYGNSAGEVLQEITPAKNKVFCHVRRYLGSGWGDIISIDKNTILGSIELFSGGNEEMYKHYANALKSINFLSKTHGMRTYLCTSLDGGKVFFAARGSEKCYIITNDSARCFDIDIFWK